MNILRELFKSNLERRIEEIEDVLTREPKENGEINRLGSEIDYKVEQKDFDELKNKLFKPKKKDEQEDSKIFGINFFTYWSGPYLSESLEERIESLEKSVKALEKYLKVQYKEETKEFKGYKSVKK